MSRAAHRPEVRAHQGRRAGILSRLLADGADLVAIAVLALLALLVASSIRGLFRGDLDLIEVPQPARGILAGLLVVAYLGYGWGLDGRTLGKIVMGLRVVDDDGADLTPGRGLLRAFLYLLVPPGLLWALVSRRNASLQDLVLGTAVVHDWALPEPPARRPATG